MHVTGERVCGRRELPTHARWAWRAVAGIDRVGPTVLLHRRDQLAAASGHDRRPGSPIRILVEVVRHGLERPDDVAGVLVDPDHAETVIGIWFFLGGVAVVYIGVAGREIDTCS